MNLIKKVKNLLSIDIYGRIFTHGFWIILGNVISKFVLLIATILMTKYLGKEEYGQFGIIKSTILMFAMFAGMELGMTATKYISQYKTNDKRKVERIVGVSNLFAIFISILITLFVFLFSNEIAIQINAPHLNTEIRICSFILFFSSMNGIQAGILAGLEKFKILSLNNAVSGIISSIMMVLSSKYFSLEIVILSFGLNFILLFLLNFFSLRKIFYNEFEVELFRRDNFRELHILWKFSLPAIFAGLMVGPVIWFCNYILVNQANGFNEMANFDIANQWRNTILFIPSALSQIVLPLLSSSLNNKDAYYKVFNVNLKINIYIGFSLVVFFVICSPLIIRFYGENYNDALWPLIIMFITTGFITINNVIGQAIASQDKMWQGFFVNLLWAFVLFTMSYLFIIKFEYGAVGLCLAYLISYISHSLIQFLYIKKFL